MDMAECHIDPGRLAFLIPLRPVSWRSKQPPDCRCLFCGIAGRFQSRQPTCQRLAQGTACAESASIRLVFEAANAGLNLDLLSLRRS